MFRIVFETKLLENEISKRWDRRGLHDHVCCQNNQNKVIDHCPTGKDGSS
jgi:hypothetical protein